MDDHFTVPSTALVSLSRSAPDDQAPLSRLVEDFLVEAWQLIAVDDFLALQQAAMHLMTCARVFKQTYMADMAALLAVAAEGRNSSRCQRFVAIIQRERCASQA